MIRTLSQLFSKHTQQKTQIQKDLAYFFQNGLWTLAGQITVSVAALVMTVAISRTLSPEDYGIYRYVMTLIPIFLLATLPNMGSALTVAIAQKKDVNISGALNAKIKWGFLATAVGLVMAVYYTLTNQPVLALSIGLASLCIPFFDTFSLYKFILQGKHDFKNSALYQSINRIIAAACVVGVVLLTNNVAIIIATILLSQIFSQWFFWQKTTKNIQGSVESTDITTFGKHLSLLGILTTVGSQLDKLLVWFFFGPIPLAIYAIILTIPLEGTRLLESISTIVLPRFSIINWNDHAKRVYVVYRILLLMIPLMLGAGLYLLFAHLLFSLLFPAYLPHVLLSQLSSSLIIAVPLGAVASQAFIAWGKIKPLVWITIVGILILLIGIFFASKYSSINLVLYTLILKEFFVFLALILLLLLPNRTSRA